MLEAPLHPNMLSIHLLSKLSKVLPVFFVSVCLIYFALFGNLILFKGGRNECTLQEKKHILKSSHNFHHYSTWFLAPMCVLTPIYPNPNKSLNSL